MNEYLLDREHFNNLVYGQGVMVGDQHWTKHEHWDDDGTWIYSRRHILTGGVTFWTLVSYDRTAAKMALMVKVPVMTYVWKIAGQSTGGSSS